MDYDDEIFNLEQQAVAISDLVLRASTARERALVVRKLVADLIDACMSVYLGDDGPVGNTFYNFSQQLIGAERVLSRLEGDLVE